MLTVIVLCAAQKYMHLIAILIILIKFLWSNKNSKLFQIYSCNDKNKCIA